MKINYLVDNSFYLIIDYFIIIKIFTFKILIIDVPLTRFKFINDINGFTKKIM